MPTIQQVMSTDFHCVSSELPLSMAEELLLKRGLPELFVTNDQGELVGILTDYALIRCRLTEPMNRLTVQARCTPVCVFLTPESSLTTAATLVRLNVNARVPVISGGQVVGIVTRRAVYLALADDSSGESTTVPRPAFLDRPAQSFPLS